MVDRIVLSLHHVDIQIGDAAIMSQLMRDGTISILIEEIAVNILVLIGRVDDKDRSDAIIIAAASRAEGSKVRGRSPRLFRE